MFQRNSTLHQDSTTYNANVDTCWSRLGVIENSPTAHRPPPFTLPLPLDKIGITTAKLHYHLSHLLIKCQDITDHRAPPILPIETTKIDSHLHLIVPSAPRLDLHIIIPFLIKFATRSLPPPTFLSISPPSTTRPDAHPLAHRKEKIRIAANYLFTFLLCTTIPIECILLTIR